MRVVINLIEFIKHHKRMVISILVLAFISYLNIPPKGYFIGGGDFYQISYLKHNYINYFFTWSEKFGTGYTSAVQYAVFFLPFYILDLFDNVAAQQFLYVFLFTFLSFISFYISQRYFINNYSEKKYSYLFSLLYAINPFTFWIFRTSAGYFPFFFLYPFIPLFLGLIFSYLNKKRNYLNKELAFFIIVSFFLSISFGNFAYLISLSIFVSLFCFLLILTNEIDISGKTLLKFIILSLSFILATLYNVISQIPLLFVANRQISNSEVPMSDIWSWMTYQRLPLKDQLIFNTDYDKSALFLFSTLLSILFITSLIYYKSKLSRILSMLAVISIFITSKGLEILPIQIVKPIFTLPLINSLRTGNKSYIFLPFFMLIVIFLCYKSTKETIIKILFLLSAILVVISCFPLLNGTTLTNYSPYYGKSENYLTAKQTYIYHLPKVYQKLNDIINPLEQDRILVLPYSVINSVGWMNYTKWKYIGVDPLISIINKPLVNPNYYLQPTTWNYGDLWNHQSEEDSLWIFPFTSITNSKYMLYHKDVDPQFIDQTIDKIKYYEKIGLISKLEENQYFIFYKINEKFFIPRVYVPKKIIISDKKIENLAELLAENFDSKDFAVYFTEQNLGKNILLLKKTSSSVNSTFEFKRINPVKLRVVAHNVRNPFPIIFSEGFHEGWEAFLVSDTPYNDNLPNGNILETLTGKSIGEDKHFKANGYANSWIIDPIEICGSSKFCHKNTDDTYDLELVFEFHQPQILFYIGLIISGIIVLISLIYLMRIKKSKVIN